MKNKVSIFLSCMSIAIFAGCASSPNNRQTVSQPPKASAQITQTRGNTEIMQGGAWKSARVGVGLREGDAIRTGAASDADLHFGEFGGAARVNPESEVWIQHFGWTNEPAGKTMVVILDLRKGRISGDTLNPAPNSRFLVKTDAGMVQLK